MILVVGSLRPIEILNYQNANGWLLFSQPVAGVILFIAMLAEANRAPFDNAEAEQELVGGYHTEYSSMRFALYFLAEYSHLITSSAIFTMLFLGAFEPIPFVTIWGTEATGFLAVLAKVGIFAGKTATLVAFAMVIRWTIPRMRYDQIMTVAWNAVIPLAMLMIVTLSVMVYKLRSYRNLHGRARFAGMIDLANKGFLSSKDNGVVVGQMNGKLLRLSGQQFVILAAPTRSGKGVGVVIPNLLDYRESAVVLDIKQENFDLTSGWRQSIGHEVYLFNPFAEDRRSHRWNPMTYVSPDPAFRVSDLQSIAAMLYPDGDDKDKFWVSQARNAFLAFTLYLFERRDHDRTAEAPTLGACCAWHRAMAANSSPTCRNSWRHHS